MICFSHSIQMSVLILTWFHYPLNSWSSGTTQGKRLQHDGQGRSEFGSQAHPGNHIFCCNLSGSGCLKPNAISHVADQFRNDDPDQATMLSTYFNTSYFNFCLGEQISLTLCVWIQTYNGMDAQFGVSASTWSRSSKIVTFERKEINQGDWHFYMSNNKLYITVDRPGNFSIFALAEDSTTMLGQPTLSPLSEGATSNEPSGQLWKLDTQKT